VKFEGDVQVAERLQGDISSALTSLTSAQNKLLTAGKPAPTPAAASAGEVRASGRKRRRKRGAGATEGIDESILEGQVESGDELDPTEVNGNGNGAAARREGAGAGSLLSNLKTEGFFKEKRTMGDIRERMAAKGHTFAPSDVSAPLVRAAQSGLLKREKNSAKQWVYSE
jgi:hypothetical protein